MARFFVVLALAAVSSVAANSWSTGSRDRTSKPHRDSDRECCACAAPSPAAGALGQAAPVVAPLNIVSQSLFDRACAQNLRPRKKRPSSASLHAQMLDACAFFLPPAARPDDARLTFFDNANCLGSKRTDIYGPHSIIGGAQKCWRDIEVSCNVELGAILPTGTVEFYEQTASTNQCLSRVGAAVGFRDGQCLPSSGGSSAMSASCLNLDASDISQSTVERGRIHVMTTFANDDCEAASPTARVLYDFAQDECQNGPAGVFFKFVCRADGSSTYTQFANAGCSSPIYAKSAVRDECQTDTEAPDSWPIGWSVAARCGAVRQ
jgi:hypothetical protein